MKLRVLLQGLAVLSVVWGVVIAAQTYFRGFRYTADRVEEKLAEGEFVDWSEREEEPTGAEAEFRNKRIREVITLFSQLEFAEVAKARESGLKAEFFDKLSPKEKEFLAVGLIGEMGTQIEAFDSLKEERREKFLKRFVQTAEFMLPKERSEALQELLNEEVREEISKSGIRPVLDTWDSEQRLQFVLAMEIITELMQRLRLPKYEGMVPDE